MDVDANLDLLGKLLSEKTDVNAELLAEKIEAARGGDTNAAKSLLESFCAAVDSGFDKQGNPLRTPSGVISNVEPELLRYLANCFRAILSGVPSEKALGLNKGKRGAHKKDTTERDVQLCYEVLRLKERGSPVKKAKSKVAAEQGVSFDTVEKAYKNKTIKMSVQLIRRMQKAEQGNK